jgi:hypothetical protein
MHMGLPLVDPSHTGLKTVMLKHNLRSYEDGTRSVTATLLRR